MSKNKTQDHSSPPRIVGIVFPWMLSMLLATGLCFSLGCHNPTATTTRAADSADADLVVDADPVAPETAVAESVVSEVETTQDETESQPKQEQGVLGKAGNLLKQATNKGSQSAQDAGRWVQDQLGAAADTGEQTAEETWQWANETFEFLKSQGMTTASDTSQWLGQDWNNMESWEYKVVTLGDTEESLTSTLNELGKQGWECFEIETRTEGTRFFFKKPTFSYLRQLPFKDMIKLVPLMNNAEK